MKTTRWKVFLLWTLLALVALVGYSLLDRQQPEERAMSRGQIEEELTGGRLRSAEMGLGGVLTFTRADGSRVRLAGTGDKALFERMREAGVTFEVARPKSLPLAADWPLLAALVVGLAVLIFFLRRSQGGGLGSILALRKTTARLVAQSCTETFADVGGAEEAKHRLGDLVDYLKNGERWRQVGARLPRGILLEGPPGCGKTLLARALAGESKVPFFEVSASEFVEFFVGVGSARVRDLFEQAAKKAPAVLFIDELDAIGRRRGSGAVSSGHQEREHTLNQLLVSMDGFSSLRGLLVLAATNRADVLDPALLRPGRFDLRLTLPPLDEKARAEVLAVHLRGKARASSVDLPALAKECAGFTGAELELLINEAAIAAVRRTRGSPTAEVAIEQQDLRGALAAHSGRKASLGQLDAVLIDSATQLVKPDGRLLLRATLDDGAQLTGELVWADERLLKLRTADGSEPLVARRTIARIEAAGGESALPAESRVDLFAHHQPESA